MCIHLNLMIFTKIIRGFISTTHDVVFNQLHLTNTLNPLNFLFIDQFLRQRNDMIYLFRRQAAVLCPLNLPVFIQHQNG